PLLDAVAECGLERRAEIRESPLRVDEQNQIRRVLDERPESLLTVPQRFFGAFQLGDVFGDTDDSIDFAGGVADGERSHPHPPGPPLSVDRPDNLVVATVTGAEVAVDARLVDVVRMRCLEELAKVFTDLDALSGDAFPDAVQIEQGAGFRVANPEEVGDMTSELAEHL